jgi:hypothetical protein
MGMATGGLSYWQAESEGIDLLDLTIGDLLDRRANELPTQEAIVYSGYPEFGDALNVRWTYQDYRNRSNALAKGLIALGFKKGDHIATPCRFLCKEEQVRNKQGKKADVSTKEVRTEQKKGGEIGSSQKMRTC